MKDSHMDIETLAPAARLAAENPVRIPNESAEYRAARTALLAEEIELEAPHGGASPPNDGRCRPAVSCTATTNSTARTAQRTFVGLFRDKETLVVYSYMFGPQRERACPMCTNLLASWEGNAADIDQKISLVVMARSPIGRLAAWKHERGWTNLRLASDQNDAYSREYFGVLPDGSEVPSLNVFTRRDGTIRHFWSAEMTGSTADPGQDPRGTPVSYAPLWNMLDLHAGRTRP